jgi:Protein of unknown function DUF262
LADDDWIDGDIPPEEDEGQIDEYDLNSTPNDFNVLTIFSFIESGAVKIPGFQRAYVWDIRRASKLIESLIIGLPVPQVFLYEEGQNSFLVIDGQQRLMTIYYFIKQRFPRKDKRAELRKLANEESKIPDEILHDDEYFENFRLSLANTSVGAPNKFARLNYATLGDYKTQLDLRTIRNVIIKQVRPSGDNSIYEIFNRLNTGGINLTPQEIRSSLYHSRMSGVLIQLNTNETWRRLLGRDELDLHMRDVEILLRAVAVAKDSENYSPSMVRFLNRFSQSAQSFGSTAVADIVETVTWFFDACSELEGQAFLSRQGRFTVPLFEAIFAAACQTRSVLGTDWRLGNDIVAAIRNDTDFQSHSQEQTTSTVNVLGRLSAARKYVIASA